MSRRVGKVATLGSFKMLYEKKKKVESYISSVQVSLHNISQGGDML